MRRFQRLLGTFRGGFLDKLDTIGREPRPMVKLDLIVIIGHAVDIITGKPAMLDVHPYRAAK
jgi:hypothetical protein